MAQAVEITRDDLSAADLRTASAKGGSVAAARRMLALASVLEGADRATAARSAGMDRQTLRDWVHRYNAEGVGGLENRSSPGAPALLSDAQQAALAAKVEAGPDVARDGVVRWRRSDLAHWLKTEFGVEIKERTVGSYLKKLGFRRISVRPAHPGRDAEAQETFKSLSPA